MCPAITIAAFAMNLTPQRRDQFVRAAVPRSDANPYWNPVRLRPAKEMIMRLLALAGTFGFPLVATSQAATLAGANPLGPRSRAQYRGASENRGFYSFNQCVAAISG